MPYTWLLFDADGTLFDYDAAERAALAQTFVGFGYPFELGYLETYRRINEQIWQAYEQGNIAQERLKVRRFELLFEAIALGNDVDAAQFSAAYLENLGNCADLVEGEEAVIKALCGKVRLALITNGLQAVQHSRLAQSSIGHAFEAMIISEEVGVAKPDPAIFDIAFRQMGRPSKDEVLIIGDSLTSDIKGGSDYGIDTCWFNPQHKPRDLDIHIRYEIRDLSALLTIVG